MCDSCSGQCVGFEGDEQPQRFHIFPWETRNRAEFLEGQDISVPLPLIGKGCRLILGEESAGEQAAHSCRVEGQRVRCQPFEGLERGIIETLFFGYSQKYHHRLHKAIFLSRRSWREAEQQAAYELKFPFHVRQVAGTMIMHISFGPGVLTASFLVFLLCASFFYLILRMSYFWIDSGPFSPGKGYGHPAVLRKL